MKPGATTTCLITMEKENWSAIEWLQASGFTTCEIDEIMDVIQKTASYVDPRVYAKMVEIAERRANVGQVLHPSSEFTTIQ